MRVMQGNLLVTDNLRVQLESRLSYSTYHYVYTLYGINYEYVIRYEP